MNDGNDNNAPLHNNTLLIQDLDQYLQQNGLQHEQDTTNQPPTLDQRELAHRIQTEQSYQRQVLNEFLRVDELAALKEQKDEMEQKEEILNLCRDENRRMIIVTDEERIVVSLSHFVDQCDTIYALVKSDHWSELQKENNGHGHGTISFDLSQFDHSSVLEFISLVQKTKTVENISPDSIIECCKIAHFLQSTSLLEEIVDIIQESVDADNCASICILADQLEIPALLQSSMVYVMDKLDNIKSHDIWNDFPLSLKHHVETLRNAARSSIIGSIGRGGQRSKVLFTSSNEFLGIFYDTLRDHKDRLKEAKMRQEEIIQERINENLARGRNAREINVYSGAVMDAAIKIEKQERRVQTLETFYWEQMLIFSRDAKEGDGAFKSSFSL